jgi:ankyrin repeat protein
MQLLLKQGADANAVNKRKSTPLFWSLHDEAKVRLLLEHGANVNARTVDGRTPVYQAASMGKRGSGASPLARPRRGPERENPDRHDAADGRVLGQPRRDAPF